MEPRSTQSTQSHSFLCDLCDLGGFIFWSAQTPAPVEWRSYAGDLRNHHYSPLAQVTAANFNALEVAWRFKTDSLGPRPEFKLEGTPLMVQRRALHHRRHAALGRRARRGDRRAALGAFGARRRARGGVASSAVRPRRRLLDRRQGRAHALRHHRLPPRRARREDRRAHPVVRQGRHRRSERRCGVRQGAADRSRGRRDRAARDAGRHEGRRRDDRRGDARRRHAEDAQQHQGAGARLRRAHRHGGCGRSTRFRGPASSATTRGRTSRGR